MAGDWLAVLRCRVGGCWNDCKSMLVLFCAFQKGVFPSVPVRQTTKRREGGTTEMEVVVTAAAAAVTGKELFLENTRDN